MSKKRKIYLVGGGTLGSVSPLLALAEKIEANYLFIGSEHGPEKRVVQKMGIPYKRIKSGKLRRYFSWENFKDIFRVKLGFFQSLGLLIRRRPNIILTSGSFVAVPVAWAAWFLRIPVIVHQQDIEVGLANKVMAPAAKKITVTFPEQVKDFNFKKVVVTGNPVRTQKINSDGIPKIVITGGGIGARGLNEFIKDFIPLLVKRYEVHHVLGDKNWDQKLDLVNYFPYKFVSEGMLSLLNDAELIISRAGMSLISEAASMKKALLLVPMPDSHQERNATYLAKRNAAIMVNQGSTQILNRYLDKLLDNDELRKGLGENLNRAFPKNAINDYKILIDSILK